MAGWRKRFGSGVWISGLQVPTVVHVLDLLFVGVVFLGVQHWCLEAKSVALAPILISMSQAG